MYAVCRPREIAFTAVCYLVSMQSNMVLANQRTTCRAHDDDRLEVVSIQTIESEREAMSFRIHNTCGYASYVISSLIEVPMVEVVFLLKYRLLCPRE